MSTKKKVFSMRPASGGPWLFCEGAEDVAEILKESDAPGEYDVRVHSMTQEEINAMPDDFEGW